MKTPTRPEQPKNNYSSLNDTNTSRGQRLESLEKDRGKLERSEDCQNRKNLH
jgi:hypothetical protein